MKKRIAEMAEALMKVAARRELRDGPGISPPDGMYREFAARFLVFSAAMPGRWRSMYSQLSTVSTTPSPLMSAGINSVQRNARSYFTVIERRGVSIAVDSELQQQTVLAFRRFSRMNE